MLFSCGHWLSAGQKGAKSIWFIDCISKNLVSVPLAGITRWETRNFLVKRLLNYWLKIDRGSHRCQMTRLSRLSNNTACSYRRKLVHLSRWLFKTFLTGFRRELDLSDLYYPLDEHSSHNVGERLSAEWKREQERCKYLNEEAPPNLMRVLIRCFGKDIIVAGLVQAFLEFFIR